MYESDLSVRSIRKDYIVLAVQVMTRLPVFLQWVADAVNSFCFDNSPACCSSVFDMLS